MATSNMIFFFLKKKAYLGKLSLTATEILASIADGTGLFFSKRGKKKMIDLIYRISRTQDRGPIDRGRNDMSIKVLDENAG